MAFSNIKERKNESSQYWEKQHDNPNSRKVKRIWKFPILEMHEYNEIEMPEGAEVLTVQMQSKVPCIWAIVDPEAPKVPRMFNVCGTGTSMLEHVERKYIGTVQIHGGLYIFHIFEILGDWRYLTSIKPE